MPIYEYKCLECALRFSELCKINDEPLERCPACGGKVKQLISKGVIDVEYANSKEYYEKVIKKEAKEITDKIKAGDENAAADVFGDK